MYTLICSQCNSPFELEKIYRNGRTTCSSACRAGLRKKTNIQRYGKDNVSQVENIKEKKKMTFIEHYGSDHFFQTDNFKKIATATKLTKYGVDHQSKSTEIKNKKKDTMIKKYGVENPSQNIAFKNKRMATHTERYGVNHSAYIGKSLESIEILTNFETLKELNKTLGISDISRKYNISYQSLSAKFIQNNVKPIRHKGSIFEREIREYIRSIYHEEIEIGNRTILDGKEIDLLFPLIGIGVECNGAYWHGELRGRQKYYHLSKMILAEKKGIRLLQIWDHEWVLQNELMKNMLHNLLTTNYKKEIPFPYVTPRDKRPVYEQMGRQLVRTTEPNCMYIRGYLDLSDIEIPGADCVWDCGKDIWQQ